MLPGNLIKKNKKDFFENIFKMNTINNTEKMIEITDNEFKNDDDSNFITDTEASDSNHRKETFSIPTYSGLNLLQQDLDYNASLYESGEINLCIYQVNNLALKPFLQFVMKKNEKNNQNKKLNDLITFPSFSFKRNDNIMEVCDFIIEIIHQYYHLNDISTYSYKGFINNNNKFYVFYDFGNCVINSNFLYRKNDLWLILVDEILNQKSVCNFEVDPAVTDFFLDNINFTYLKDENNNFIETPTVVYSGCDKKDIDFKSLFGVSSTLEKYLPIPYYYFTDYQNAVKLGTCRNEDVMINNCGIVRYAVFLGYMINYKDNTNKNCNSIYINIDEHPYWALIEYEQQYTLSSHYIDESYLGKKWDNKQLYFIK